MRNWIELEEIPSILKDIAQVLFASMFISQFFVENPSVTVITYGFLFSVCFWLASLISAKKFKN